MELDREGALPVTHWLRRKDHRPPCEGDGRTLNVQGGDDLDSPGRPV